MAVHEFLQEAGKSDMGRKVIKIIKDDIWVILLDIIAVNAAYYLALLIRFHFTTSQTLKNLLILAQSGN